MVEQKFDKVLDSGNRTDFGTGSVRDLQKGKGLFHLIPWDGIDYASRIVEKDDQKYHIIDKTYFCLENKSGPEQLFEKCMVNLKNVCNFQAFLRMYESCNTDDIRNNLFMWFSQCSSIALYQISHYVQYNIDSKSCGKWKNQLIPPGALRRLAVHFENGGEKYGNRNWELGQPLHAHYNSATRHLLNIQSGDGGEDHEAAAIWNILCMLTTRYRIHEGILPEFLNDICSIEDFKPCLIGAGMIKDG